MLRNILVAALALSLLSCTSTSRRADSFGKKIVQRVHETQLKNGLTVLYVKDDTLPYIHLSLMVGAGASSDPDRKDGLSVLTANLVDKGTLNRSATEIADAFGQLGSSFTSTVREDYTVFSAETVTPKEDTLLDLFADIVLNPSFQEAEFRRLRQRYVAAAQKRVDSPSHFAALAWEKYVFDGHPYAKVDLGTPQSLGNIQRRDINKHYLVHFRPNKSYLAVVGKWSPELEKKIQERFSQWEPFEAEKAEEDAPEMKITQGVRVVNQTSGVQSQIFVGHPSIARTHPDYQTLQVATTILGGAFESRLMKRIRKELGLTYGVSAAVYSGLELGVFQVSLATRTEATAQVLEEIHKVLSQAVEEGLTQEELESTKGYLSGRFPRSIEQADRLAFMLLELRRMGLPDTEITGYLSRLRSIKLDEVNQVLKRHIQPDHVKILIYGQRAPLQKQLQGKTVEWVSHQRAL